MTPTDRFDIAALFDADEYLHFMARTLAEEDTPAQCSFIEHALALAPRSRVLDLGCGHGRHALELARRGHQVVGVDLVPGFIERARAAAAREGLACEFHVGDARSLQADGGFDAVLSLFDAFGFHDDADHGRILDNALAALRPGGRLLLDLRNREHFLRQPPVNVVELDNGDLMIDRLQFDIVSGRVLDRRTTLRGSVRRDTVFSVRLYTVPELHALLAAHGWRLQAQHGGFDGAPLAAARPRMLFVAERPASPWQ